MSMLPVLIWLPYMPGFMPSILPMFSGNLLSFGYISTSQLNSAVAYTNAIIIINFQA